MNNLIKRILSVLLILFIFISSAGCRKNREELSSSYEGDTVVNSKDYITLLYSAADTFNPYTVQSDINRQLCKLLYEPLVKLDNNFNAVYSLAQTVKTQGKKCTVILKDANFSDGSTVTAKDVVYSCKLAINSDTGYAAQLYKVESVTSEGDNTVVFTLKSYDAYFENLLSFPILKAESENIMDSDNVLQPPIGSGRFKVSKDKTYLEKNEHYYKSQGNINIVKLINAPDYDSVAHYIEIGATDLYYNEGNDGEIIRMSGERLSLNLNNIVYIGVNQNNQVLSQKNIRQAISSAIDRTKICKDAYYSNAISANGFYNPNWSAINSVQNIEITANKELTIENLNQIGYNKVNESGIRTNAKGQSLKFTLLVNSENRIRVVAAKLIASQLKECGIGITVLERSYEKYKESLEKGDFQLYLGEVKITDNMDLSPLVCEDGNCAYGYVNDAVSQGEGSLNSSEENIEPQTINSVSASQIIKGYYEEKYTLTDVAQVLQDQMPIIPICYRNGVLFYNSNLKNVEGSSVNDIYFSIDKYVYNIKK